jgi:hypothetical protein
MDARDWHADIYMQEVRSKGAMVADFLTKELGTGPLEACKFDHGTVSLFKQLADGIRVGRP